MLKVIIAGSRGFNDFDLLKSFCDSTLKGRSGIEVVSGNANGADKLGERYAEERGFPVKRFIADWGKFGLAAGPKRNAQMAEYGDILIAFWDGKSAGTRSMIRLAKKHNRPVFVCQL